MLHPHAWIRLASCQLYGLLFAAYTPDDLVDLVTTTAMKTKKKRGRKSKVDMKLKLVDEYLLQDTVAKVCIYSNVWAGHVILNSLTASDCF